MEKLNELQTEIAQELVESANRFDWKSLMYNFREAADLGESSFQIVLKSGETESIDDSSSAIWLFGDLRKAMATPEHGTWFSATVAAVRDGDFEINFNYDQKPAWDVEPDPETYIEDQHRYPRPQQELPDWHPAKNRAS